MSLLNIKNDSPLVWDKTDKIILRTFFLYFLVLILPLDWKFYSYLFSTDWLQLNFYNLFILARYEPHFFGWTGFENWLFAFLLALLGAWTWDRFEKEEPNFDLLLYWLRVLLRYRLAIAAIAFGLIKVFPLQMPYPSLSNLHTNYGDFFPWKIYYHTTGVAQGYEIFLGTVEIVSGILLLFRRTVTFGAGVLIGFFGNIFAANIAYHMADQVFAAFLVSIATFLFMYDAKRLFHLLIKNKLAEANRFHPSFSHRLKKIRLLAKGVFIAFLWLLAFKTYANFRNEPYKVPKSAGLAGTYGYYNVKEFRLNNQVIPYSVSDTNRWQNVVFEKWTSISIKSAKPLQLDQSFGDVYHLEDYHRNYESAGIGGRRYFHYDIDSVNHQLFLKNKNPHHDQEQFILQYHFPNDSTIILKGVNEKKDSIYAELHRVNKKYLLFEGRRKRVKL